MAHHVHVKQRDAGMVADALALKLKENLSWWLCRMGLTSFKETSSVTYKPTWQQRKKMYTY